MVTTISHWCSSFSVSIRFSSFHFIILAFSTASSQSSSSSSSKQHHKMYQRKEKEMKLICVTSSKLKIVHWRESSINPLSSIQNWVIFFFFWKKIDITRLTHISFWFSKFFFFLQLTRNFLGNLLMLLFDIKVCIKITLWKYAIHWKYFLVHFIRNELKQMRFTAKVVKIVNLNQCT